MPDEPRTGGVLGRLLARRGVVQARGRLRVELGVCIVEHGERLLVSRRCQVAQLLIRRPAGLGRSFGVGIGVVLGLC